MKILRYYFIIAMYHFSSFFKLHPFAFIHGLLKMVTNLLTGLMLPSDQHDQAICISINGLREYWKYEGAILPPSFVVRRLEALSDEIRCSV